MTGILVLAAPVAAQDPASAATAPSYGRTPEKMVPYRRAVIPYRSFYLTPPLYRGPGRSQPAPVGLESVRIGLLAAADLSAPEGGGVGLTRGVQLAIEQANEAGGYNGVPFEIVAAGDGPLWGSSANALVQLAYAERVWAVIGSVDATSSHVALRVALKAEVPIVNVGAADPTLTETGIPWLIRCTPDDRQTGYRLATLLFEQEDVARVAVVRSSDRYGRAGVKEFRDAAARLGRPVPLEILFEPGSEDLAFALDRIDGARVDAVVLWAGTVDGARIVKRMRERGMRQRIVGTDRLAVPRFLQLAGAAAEGVSATAWAAVEAGDPQWLRFRQAYQQRFGDEPDMFAAYGYDAGALTLRSVRRAGLNRALIRDELTAVREVDGVAGRMQFDSTFNNIAPLEVMTVRAGRFVPLSSSLVAAVGVGTADSSSSEVVMPSAPGSRSVRIGLVIESEADAPGLLMGAMRAAREANELRSEAGYSLEVVPIRSGGPWADTGSQVAQLAAAHGVSALAGASSGAVGHVTAQVATRLRIPALLVAPEVSLTRASDPWVFRALASDRQQAFALLDALLPRPHGSRVAFVAPPGREGRERLLALREVAEELSIIVLATPATYPSPAAPPAGGDALLLWLDSKAALDYLRKYAAELPPVVVGSSRLLTCEFVQAVRRSGHSVVLPVGVVDSSDAVSVVKQLCSGGDPAERLGHELVQRLAAAGRHGGDPTSVRENLAAAVDDDGTQTFDQRGNLRRQLTLVRVSARGTEVVREMGE